MSRLKELRAYVDAELNKIENRVSFFVRDIRENSPDDDFPGSYFDLVTVNPPYMTESSGFVSDRNGSARTELTCGIADAVKAAYILLKNGGRFCMINKPERMTDALCVMREYRLEPKRLTLVTARNGMKPELFLTEGIKEGKPGLFCEPVLEIYGPDGEYTEALRQIYGRR